MLFRGLHHLRRASTFTAKMSTQVQPGTSAKPAATTTTATKPSKGLNAAFAPPPAVEIEPVDGELIYIHRPLPIRERQKKDAELAKEGGSGGSSINAVSTSRGPPPAAVLLQGWMDGPLRIVAKYAAVYARLFPEATIVLQLSTGKSFMSPEAVKVKTAGRVSQLLAEVETRMGQRDELRGQQRELEEGTRQAGIRMDVDAQNTLAAQKGASDPSDISRAPRGVVIHTFSDGGATNLARFLPILNGTNGHPAVLAHVLDCCPGISSPSSGATAFTVPLLRRNWLVRQVAWWSVWFYFGLLLLYRRLIGRRSWSLIMRHQLNSPGRWLASSSTAKEGATKSDKETLPPRLYVYSKADRLIRYQAVEKHVEEAAAVNGYQKGALPVETITRKSDQGDADKKVIAYRSWDGAAHCDILRADPQGYIDALRQFYETVL